MKKLLIFALIAAAATALLAQLAATTPAGKLRYAEQSIAKFYVDTVNEDELVETAIISMLEKLDPHSSYSDPEETRALTEGLEGNFSGIGITYNMIQDTVFVISTVQGGPSQKVGIQPGDRIIAVNGEPIAGVKLKDSEVRKHLRGEKGTHAQLTVLRGREMVEFDVVRDDIPVHTVDAAYMTDPTTGYISLTKFGAETPDEFRKAVRKLTKQGMKNLILDLTDNSGGYLNASVGILSEMLAPGSLAVYTEGTHTPRHNYTTNPLGAEPMLDGARIVVMVNQYSASASEITAGALQDWDRAVIVGRRSYGKGLVQRPIPFPDGSMMRLTIAHYYTPTGRDIQKPYVKGDDEAYGKDILDRFNGGELMHADSIHVDSTKAVATRMAGRTVYGGGGIIPDVFVPLDTMPNTPYLRSLNAKHLINQVAVNYVDAHRKELRKRYKNSDSYISGFTVSPELMAQVRALGDAEGVKFDEEQWKRSEAWIELNLKALIGRNVYDENTDIKLYNSHNDIYREALRIIHSDDYERLLKGQ